MLLFFLTYNVFRNQIIARPFKLPLNSFFFLCSCVAAETLCQNCFIKTARKGCFFSYKCVLYLSNMSFRISGQYSSLYEDVRQLRMRDRKKNNYWKPLTENFTWFHFQKCAHMQRRFPETCSPWQESVSFYILACENGHRVCRMCQNLDEGRRSPDWVMWLHIIPQINQHVLSAHICPEHSNLKYTTTALPFSPKYFTPS